jgi:hypothetical protein
MSLSPLQRIVSVTYEWTDVNGQRWAQEEHWTIAQCTRDNVRPSIVNKLKFDIQSDPNEPARVVYDDSPEALRGDSPRSYTLRPEYSSTLYCKTTIDKRPLEAKWVNF